MSTGELTSYEEIADVLVTVPVLLRETRRRRQLSVRGAARELGVSFSTVFRIENGEDYNSRMLPSLFMWLGRADQTVDQP